jgi:PKD repeat protein
VTASFASNTITISGTPTVSGVFNYSIPLSGGCGTVSATGTITVTPANTVTLTSGVGTNNQTVCANSAITTITYSTTGATGATVTGLPSGVTGNWSADVVTINGTPTAAAGIYNYTVTLTGGCGTVTTGGTITINALPVTSAITGTATPPCSGVDYVYSVTNTPGSDYAWTVPAGATITDGQGSHSITVTFGTSNGNITVTETNSSGCDGAPRTLAISLQGCGLDANFEGDPTEICIGSSVVFTNISTGTSGSTSYSWNFGAGASPATANTAGPHTVTYNTAGTKTVTLTITEGASNTETKTNYITVNPLNTVNLTSGAGTDNQTLCLNSMITDITYSTTGANGASVTGLPAGVNGSWSANVVTISGTPSESGTFNYTVTLTGGCGTVTENGILTVNICTRTLSLSSVLLEGLYDGGGTMRQAWGETGTQWPAGIADHITVELHDAGNYWTIIHTAADVELTTEGAAVITIPAEHSGSYYITVKHRNSIETTTAAAVSFSGTTINYSFNSLSSVYGENMGISGDGRYLIFAGDVNQDGFIDTQDYIGIDNDSYNYAYGYLVTDVDGNGMVDTNDYIPIDNNNYRYIGVILP